MRIQWRIGKRDVEAAQRRYEIPLDSRVTKWLQGLGFPFGVKALGDPHVARPAACEENRSKAAATARSTAPRPIP